MSRLAVILSMLVITAFPAFAQQVEDPILTMPDGQAILNISATVHEEVEQDVLVATLSFVKTHRDQNVVQREINEAMQKAVALAKKEEKDVKLNTGSYQVYEYTEPRTKEKKWRGSQSLTLKSKKAEPVLELAGQMQELGLTMNGLSYMLDPQRAADIQDQLLERALRQLQTRATRAAEALGKSSADLREINTQSGGIPYQKTHHRGAMMEMAMASDAMAAPVAEAGETTITLTVSARAILKP